MVNNRFRRWRTDQGWSQAEAAAQLGVSQALISSIERGDTRVTKVSLAQRIAQLSASWSEGPIRIEEWVEEAEHPSNVTAEPNGGE